VGHPPSGRGYCRTCGPATSCLFVVYLDAVIETAVRRTVACLEGRPLPELWDSVTVAAQLGVSGFRVRELRRRPDFPWPAYPRLNGGLVWTAEQIRAFDRAWDRTLRPGRPRKKPRKHSVVGDQFDPLQGAAHDPVVGAEPLTVAATDLDEDGMPGVVDHPA